MPDRPLEPPLRAVLDAMVEGVVAMNERGEFLFANAAAAGLLGHASATPSYDELKVERQVLLADGVTPVRAEDWPLARALRGETVERQELVVKPAHAPRGVRVEVSTRPMLDPDSGAIRGAVSVYRDVGELRRTQARLQALSDASREIAEAGASIEAVLRAVLGRTAALIGESCSVHVVDGRSGELSPLAVHDDDPEMRAYLEQALARTPIVLADEQSYTGRALRSGEPIVVPVVDMALFVASVPAAFRPVAERYRPRSLIVVPLRVRGAPIGVLLVGRRSPVSAPYDASDVAFARDIGDRAALAIDSARLHQRLEQRVVERTRELEQALREIEAFSYSVSHDLRAPLRAIDGFTRAALEDPEHAREDLGRVLAAAERMGQIIEGLLALARAGRAELGKRDVDLTGLARLVVADLAAAVPDGVVEVKIAEGLRAHGDPALLRAALENLLGNAFKFTARRAVAHVELGQTELRGERVFFVRDDGAGFDPAYAGKLFGIFRRLHGVHEFPGTGIGLALVKRILARHGGRIWAESAPEQGATFYFTIGG
jgi:signal transduction histidine kinase